jgi:hypothetical protein
MRDDDFRDRLGGFGAAVDVLDHRPAVDRFERLAGESGRRVPCGDDGDDLQRRGSDGIDRGTGRSRVHDE